MGLAAAGVAGSSWAFRTWASENVAASRVKGREKRWQNKGLFMTVKGVERVNLWKLGLVQKVERNGCAPPAFRSLYAPSSRKKKVF